MTCRRRELVKVMIRAVVWKDDEELARTFLRDLLRGPRQSRGCAPNHDAFEAVKAVAETSPDLSLSGRPNA